MNKKITNLTINDVVTILKELQQEIEENVLADNPNNLLPFLQARETCVAVIQQKINELKIGDKKIDKIDGEESED